MTSPLASNDKQLVEGAYELLEVRAASRTFGPPTVDGRFVMANGVMILIVTNNSDPGNAFEVTQYGRYELSAHKFSYAWEYRRVFSHLVAAPPERVRLTFEGSRSFSIDRKPENIRLVSDTEGVTEFSFFADRLEYSENGALLRVWRRI